MLNIIEEMFSFFHFKTQIVQSLCLDVDYIDKAQRGFGGKKWRPLTILTGYARWRFVVGTSCVEMLPRENVKPD